MEEILKKLQDSIYESAGDASLAVSNVVEGTLSAGEEIPTKGTFVIGTVKDDIHSIGKSLVSIMMKPKGLWIRLISRNGLIL